ncbi:hypothetical protein PUMCH_004688 [Australozyma saopauloensis]|uniref:Uncharacterized protein n=1 Tax=Australozyma saopauloensis TaxID=291208 RepID=A0AAX4HGC2_9ASCO|nr:hypothetical protein PUMCH_004688 [[Candida] saopauloensis]
MDGTLLNTEDIYTEATTQVLSRYGLGKLTWDIKLDLQGRPGHEATKRLLAHYKLDVSPEEFSAQTTEVQNKLWNSAQFLDGALELLQALKLRNVPMALGTSSARDKYFQKTALHREAFEMFGTHVVTGDDPRIPPGRGKPEADIWLVCLQSLNEERVAEGLEPIAIEECLIFEDGIPGVILGKNANGHVIWIPHPEAVVALDGKELEILPEKGELLASLRDFDAEKYGL